MKVTNVELLAAAVLAQRCSRSYPGPPPDSLAVFSVGIRCLIRDITWQELLFHHRGGWAESQWALITSLGRITPA